MRRASPSQQKEATSACLPAPARWHRSRGSGHFFNLENLLYGTKNTFEATVIGQKKELLKTRDPAFPLSSLQSEASAQDHSRVQCQLLSLLIVMEKRGF